ncbi:MAG: peptide chain release factor N(5)-glutamine methyltransferase [candidate division KSB1 bacterium]|nr:peptide chain release factor N(5)-glutamine methyltransferase [candidate division KSB1 bacterium]
MSIAELLTSAEAALRAVGIESPRREAEWLLAEILHTDRARLYLMRDRRLTTSERENFEALVRRRAQREPLQYILGKCEFYGFEFVVSPAVLIPRPETELLVEKVAELLSAVTTPRIVDLGTGSGCIAVTLAKLCRRAQIVVTDISAAALEVARTNAKAHGVAAQIDFRLMDLTQPGALSPQEQFDFVVSNPPYVLEAERESLPPEIRNWEPPQALYVYGDGLQFYRCIINFCYRHLKSEGWVACEMASQRSQAIAKLFREAGFFHVQLIKDLSGFDRHLIAQKKNRRE